MISYKSHLRHYKKRFDSALSTLELIAEKAKNDVKKVDESENKKKKKPKKLTEKQVSRLVLLRNVLKKRNALPRPGKVYTFIYHPVAKKTLPFYDVYPLTLITSVDIKKKTFIGINFHYVSPGVRRKFYNLFVLKYYSKGMDRLVVSGLVKRLKGSLKSVYRNCIKQYRFENVLRLQMLEISPLLLNEINKVNDETFVRKKIAEVHRLARRIRKTRIR